MDDPCGAVTPKTREQWDDADLEEVERAIETLQGELRTKAMSRLRFEAGKKHVDDMIAANLALPKKKQKPTSTVVTEAVLSLLARGGSGVADVKNIEALTRFYQGIYHSRVSDMIKQFRVKALDNLTQMVKNAESKEEKLLVRAIFGEDVGNDAIMKMAKDWNELVEEMRADFVAAGGQLAKLETWRLPQEWDAKATRHHFPTAEEFVEFMWKKVDRTAMLKRVQKTKTVNGKVKKVKGTVKSKQQMDDDELRKMLTKSWNTIVSGGASKGDPAHSVGKKTGVALRKSREREIHLLNAEAWLELNKKLGKDNTIFDKMISHVNNMAHDTANIEILPQDAFEKLVNYAERLASAEDAIPKRGKYGLGANRGWLNAVHRQVSGTALIGDAEGFARWAERFRNIVVIGKLGKAFLSALIDTAFTVKTAQLNGLSPMNVLARQFKSMVGTLDKEGAMVLGLTGEGFLHGAHMHKRFGEMAFEGSTGKLAQLVLRSSGLSSWTHGGHIAFGLEANAALASQFGKTMDQLDPAIQRMFRKYSITPEKWDAWRALGKDENGFASMTVPEARDFHRLITTESMFSTPTPDARTRAITTAGLGRDSVTGQGVRALMNLKSFAISVMTLHWQRAMDDMIHAGAMSKFAYAGQLVLHTTMMGMVVIYAKEIISGKEPRDLDDEEAFMQLMYEGFVAGGSGGVLVDMFGTDPYAYGGGGLGDKILRTTTGGVINDLGAMLGYRGLAALGSEDEYEGEEYLRDLTVAVRRNAPSVWWASFATDAIGDAIERTVAPDLYRDKQARIDRREREKYGRGHWND